MADLPPDMPLPLDAPSGSGDPGASRAELVRAIEQISTQLEQLAGGQPGARVQAPITDTAIAGLVTRLNMVLEAADRRALRAEVARKQLEALNMEVDRFAYIASHDLQEPLRIISSFLGLLDRRYGEQLDEAGQEFVAYAQDGAARMQEMIRGLLAYSRVGRAGQRCGPVALAEAVEAAIEELRLEVFQNSAEIHYEELPQVNGNHSELVQLFQHLLSNAIRFRTEEPPRVWITAAPEGAMWHLQVRDAGIGIPPADAERVFELFQRLHSQDEAGGSGVGLAICKKIVEAHGGQIWAERAEAGGGRIHLTLPATSSGAPAASASAEPPVWSAAVLTKEVKAPDD